MVVSATSDEKQSSSHEQQTSLVLNDLRHYLTGVEDGEAVQNETNNDDDDSNENEHRSDVALPVAAIKTLLGVIKRSTANTMMGLQADLRKASDDMIAFVKSSSPNNSLLLGGRSHIALASGCELFLKYVPYYGLIFMGNSFSGQQVCDEGISGAPRLCGVYCASAGAW
eukprot:scaffold85943_cov56-Attheya_sp.AAC.1